jgi:Tfp pilus assembly protein PilF
VEHIEPQSCSHQANESSQPAPRTAVSSLWRICSVALPIVATCVCFANAIGNEFTNWDDPLYVLENDLITSLAPAHLKVMFSTFLVGNYHPLTVLSLAFDYWLYGLNSSGFHATSVAIHLCNVVLVLAVTQMLSGSRVVSIVAALLFGIHPLHVESVSWVSERKDVLYAFFYICALCTHIQFLRSTPHKQRHFYYYYATILLFLCSLLSKAQAVTLPVALLLIDTCMGCQLNRRSMCRMLPFFTLAVVFGVLAVVAQKHAGAIPDMPTLSFVERVVCAPLNIVLYVAKLIAPVKLSAFYPYPALDNWLSYILYLTPAACVVVLIAVGARRLRGLVVRDRIAFFGVAFFLINIALLLQVLPVGASMISERYAYLSSVGLCMLLGYGFNRVWCASTQNPSTQQLRLRVLAVCALTGYSVWLMKVTIERNTVWRDSETLWSDVLRQFPRATIAYLNRGSYYQVRGDHERALADFNAGLIVAPNHADILANRCDVLRQTTKYERAIADCTKALELSSRHTAAYTNRGITYSMIGKRDEALADFKAAIALEPWNPKHYSNLGNLYNMSGMYDVAIEYYSRAVALRPDYYTAYFNRAKTRLRKQDFQGAIADFNVSIRSPSLREQSYFYRSQADRELHTRRM